MNPYPPDTLIKAAFALFALALAYYLGSQRKARTGNSEIHHAARCAGSLPHEWGGWMNTLTVAVRDPVGGLTFEHLLVQVKRCRRCKAAELRFCTAVHGSAETSGQARRESEEPGE